jgi:hypothetical protein
MVDDSAGITLVIVWCSDGCCHHDICIRKSNTYVLTSLSYLCLRHYIQHKYDIKQNHKKNKSAIKCIDDNEKTSTVYFCSSFHVQNLLSMIEKKLWI